MLIEIEPDVYVQANQIEIAEPIRRVGSVVPASRVTFASGRHKVFDVTPDTFTPYTGRIVPAPAGYSVITSHKPHEYEPEPFHIVLPVVAFRVTGTEGGPLQPVTDEGEPSDTSHWALVRPDGTVVNWDRSYDNVEEYKATFAKEYGRAAA